MTTRFPRIKRSVPGIGLVRLASRATSKRQHARRITLLDELIEADQVDTIKQLVAGGIKWSEIAQHRREKGRFGVGVLTDIKGRRRLDEAVEETLPKMGKTEATRTRYGVTWKRLTTLLGSITVGGLETVDYAALQEKWGRSASDWNHVGRFLSAFVTVYLEKHHPLRYAIVKAFPTRAEQPRVPDITPELFWSIVDKLPVKVKAGPVVLLLTGMRVDEYLALTVEHLMPHTFRIRVPGTKTEESAGIVSVDPEWWPWITAGVPSRVRYKWLRLHWCRACVAAGAATWNAKLENGYEGLTLHSLRHALAQWASDAGVGLSDVKHALRHANIQTTEKYARRSSAKKVAGVIGGLLHRGPTT